MIQNIALRLQHLSIINKSVPGAIGTLQRLQEKPFFQEFVPIQKNIHTSTILCGQRGDPKHFLSYNNKFYPIQTPDEERRPAVSCLKLTLYDLKLIN